MKKIMMVLAAGMMSFGLAGCGDDKECSSYSNCRDGNGDLVPGYSCDNSSVCYSTIEQCQSSSSCE